MDVLMRLNPQDMSCKYGGRVVRLDVFVNTNEDINDLISRVSKAARGQFRNAVLIGGSLHDGDEGAEIWSTIQRMSTNIAADARSVEVDDELKPL